MMQDSHNAPDVWPPPISPDALPPATGKKPPRNVWAETAWGMGTGILYQFLILLSVFALDILLHKDGPLYDFCVLQTKLVGLLVLTRVVHAARVPADRRPFDYGIIAVCIICLLLLWIFNEMVTAMAFGPGG